MNDFAETKATKRAIDIAAVLRGADLHETLSSIGYIIHFTVDQLPGSLDKKIELLKEWFELTIDAIKENDNVKL